MQINQSGFKPSYQENAPTLEQVTELTGSALLEFGTPWCGYCQAAESAVEQVLSEYSELPHIKVYDGKGKALGRAFKVKLWPTLILLQDGKEIARAVRPVDADEIRQLIAQSN